MSNLKILGSFAHISPNFAFSSLVLTAVHLRAKLEISRFICTRYIRESHNYKSGWRDHHMIPFDLIFHVFSSVLTPVHLCVQFEVSRIIRPEDICGSQNYKIGWRDPHMTPMTKFCMFSLVLIAVHLFAIFEVSSFICPGDIRGPNIKKWITCSAHDLIWPNFAFFVCPMQFMALDRYKITWVFVCVCVCPQNVSSTIATTIFFRSSWNLERGSEM